MCSLCQLSHGQPDSHEKTPIMGLDRIQSTHEVEK